MVKADGCVAVHADADEQDVGHLRGLDLVRLDARGRQEQRVELVRLVVDVRDAERERPCHLFTSSHQRSEIDDDVSPGR